MGKNVNKKASRPVTWLREALTRTEALLSRGGPSSARPPSSTDCLLRAHREVQSIQAIQASMVLALQPYLVCPAPSPISATICSQEQPAVSKME